MIVSFVFSVGPMRVGRIRLTTSPMTNSHLSLQCGLLLSGVTPLSRVLHQLGSGVMLPKRHSTAYRSLVDSNVTTHWAYPAARELVAKQQCTTWRSIALDRRQCNALLTSALLLLLVQHCLVWLGWRLAGASLEQVFHDGAYYRWGVTPDQQDSTHSDRVDCSRSG